MAMNIENIFDISYMVTRVKPKGHYGEAYERRRIDGRLEDGIIEE